MRRRPAQKAKLGVQMFSFLAVLLCTMGALITMLIVVLQQAKLEAAVIHQAVAEETKGPAVDIEALERERAEQDWRKDALQESRAQKTKELANQRLELSHLEDHIRRLEGRWKQLRAEAEKLQQSVESHGSGTVAAQYDLASLQSNIEAARQELEKAQAEAANRRRTFAIVPYAGPNGTSRRPIYIECSQERIVMQPEGIVFRADDFEGPMSAGNPLDAALRATREYLARNGDTKTNGEPYPLLIVRPDGAVAYAAARAAMKSWDDEFGYELIDQNLSLAYPKSDPALVEELTRAVADARHRQQILAAAMPNQYRPKSRGLYASRAGGGFVLEEDLGVDGDSLSTNSNSHGARNSREPGGFTGASGSGEPGSGGTSFSASGTGTPRAGQPDAVRPGQMGQKRNEKRSTRAGSAEPNYGSTGLQDGAGDNNSEQSDPGAGGELASETIAGGQQADSSIMGNASFSRRAAPGSLAKARGSNWGTPHASRGLTGITRPIQVQCLPDRLVILPERGDRAKPLETILAGETSPGMDKFVADVWTRINGWGLAVAGGYWKPVLVVQVSPQAESRFTDLQALLEDSGFEVKRKSP